MQTRDEDISFSIVDLKRTTMMNLCCVVVDKRKNNNNRDGSKSIVGRMMDALV